MSGTNIPGIGTLAGTQPGLLPVTAPVIAQGSTVLTVGVGEEYTTIAAAVAAAQNGDTILVNAGTYLNDFATITANITLEGVGGMVDMVATEPPPNLKGILTVDNNATIENFSFSGATIDSADGGNAAGIRYEGGQMVLENDSFSNNQDGILAFPVLSQFTLNTVSIDHSVFSDNGSGTGYTHNIYVGAVNALTMTNSISDGAIVGHDLKSRALVNTIQNNIFADGTSGTSSYEIDLPDGGVDTIANNIIEKGPNAQNDAMVHFGGEGIPYAGSTLTISDNSFINDFGPSAVAVLNQTAISVNVSDNAFTSIANSQLVQGPATGSGNTDGAGNALPPINLVGVLPGNTTIFTDNIAHTVTLSSSGQAVEGGGGLLTVIDPAGHVVAIGGAGGMIFTEGAGAGGSDITTAIGSTNTLTLVGQDQIDSQGTDTIIAGADNLTATISGIATIDDGTGNNNWSVNGTANIVGQGGNPVVALGAQGTLSVTGTLGYLNLQSNGGTATINIVVDGLADALNIDGGGVDAVVNLGTMYVTTAGGTQGAQLTFGAGTMQVTSTGADTIRAGAGAADVIVSGAAVVYAGTGTLALYGQSDTSGATFYGNGGTYTIDGNTGNITYYGGTLASTIEDRLSNDVLIGGAGRLQIFGGSRETIIGGSGGIVYNANDGGGANTITTNAAASDVLTLAAADVVTSQGTDTIYAGTGNQNITVTGNALINGSSGNSAISLAGRDTLIGSGQDNVTVKAGAAVNITAGSNTTVTETGATVGYTVATGAHAASLSVSGGNALITGGTQSKVALTTGKGAATSVTLVSGSSSVTINGADTVHATTGADTIAVFGANSHLFAGGANLTILNNDSTVGDNITVQGGTGVVNYAQGGTNLDFIGSSGTASINGGSGSLSITGGTGNLTVTGGSSGLKFVAGSGTANLTLTPGGADITFGTGVTSVQEASYGAADLYRLISGSGGGSDAITGFRAGVDHLLLQGVGVVTETVMKSGISLTLTDHTRIYLPGVTNPSKIFS